MQRLDVIVFGGYVHSGYTKLVDVLIRQRLAGISKEHQPLIEDLLGQEVGPCSAVEGCTHFDHPVGHLGPVVLRHLMAVQWTFLAEDVVRNGELEIVQDLFLLEGNVRIMQVEVIEHSLSLHVFEHVVEVCYLVSLRRGYC